ncbi:MAG TPA: hypothetical protein VFJ91_08850 [Gaiellaceae bacterium]|nr:hypothetical protein [Gaiellaceae bacterium]
MQPPEDLATALRRRVRQAIAEAEHAVERSEALAAARRLVRERALLKRCAWCGRVSFGGGWQGDGDLPGFVPERVREEATHGICPRCFGELERDGKTHPRG